MGKPEIRFKGYTDEWEQRKLGKVAKFRQGIQVDLEKQYTEEADNRERFIRIIDYTQGTNDIRYIDKIGNANYVDEKDVVVVRYGATAGFIGRGITGIIANNMFTINPSEELNKEFLYTYMKQDKMYNYLNLSNGSSAMPAINFGIMTSLNITYPSVAEQQKIGTYFSNLDHLITLHQRKCDEVKSLKKYMLQKMFPQNEQKVPEIRFEGFTEAWEQHKVGEFLTESRESGHKGDVAHKMTVKLWGKGVYEKNDAGSVNTQYFTRHAGQFIYSKLDFLNCAFGVVPEELESLETTADVPAFDCDGVNPHFMFYTAIQPSFYEKNGMIADGSRKAKRIHVDTFLDMPFIVPSLEEQNKIVNLLSGLDDLLTLHQQKCEELKKIKKFMLQKMFV